MNKVKILWIELRLGDAPLYGICEYKGKKCFFHQKNSNFTKGMKGHQNNEDIEYNLFEIEDYKYSIIEFSHEEKCKKLKLPYYHGDKFPYCNTYHIVKGCDTQEAGENLLRDKNSKMDYLKNDDTFVKYDNIINIDGLFTDEIPFLTFKEDLFENLYIPMEA
jgi:hypothetical protein